ncbi:hypothetical protein [Leptospira weilii]|uniref:hypothetical protein n=1 Tax=Leptospira weilii TaxID=28184 RepID=UPI00037D86B1|nr:hypothetical protein [Leptospira weilii]
MSAIKGHTRNGSLLRVVQPSLPLGNVSLTEDKEFLIPIDKSKVLSPKKAASYLGLPIRSFNRYVIDHEIPFIEWSPRVRRYLITDLDKIALSLKTTKQIY